ncbi:hypothetical protein [Streptomyces lydicus]|uniref:hypothetical protein n=1 Tax=Streptomyces lydicus TaxID=47763 RepID=UPI0010117167|nr:hypothetical protein [Streptomyces lydicus]MCZ1006384.1 hypothetical protein [Streptomyces lydicus]
MTTTTSLTVAEGAALMGAPEQIRTTPAPRPSTPFRTADEREQDVAARFRKDTARHQMTILHDDGLYRHLRFTSNPHGYGEYWFDLITWPGRLAMCGDIGEDYVFSRTADMFEFFRTDRRWGINPHYWAEKLGGGRRSVKEYSEDLLRQLVVERFVSDARFEGVPAGTGKALRTWVLDEDLSDEHLARNVLESFAYQGYEFADDVWEWDFHDYTSSFLWACHAIAWGIGQYDVVKAAKPGRITAIRRVCENGRWRVKWRLDGARRVRSVRTAAEARDYMRYLEEQAHETAAALRTEARRG